MCAGKRVILRANWGTHGRPGDEGTWIDFLPGASRQISHHQKSGISRIRGHGRDRLPPSILDYGQLIHEPEDVIRDLEWRPNNQVLWLDDLHVTDAIRMEGGRIKVDLLPIFEQIEAQQFRCRTMFVSQLRKELRARDQNAFIIYAPTFRESLTVIRVDDRTIVVPSTGARRGRQFRLPYYKFFGAVVDREILRCIPEVVEYTKTHAKRLEAEGAKDEVLRVGKAHASAKSAMAEFLASRVD